MLHNILKLLDKKRIFYSYFSALFCFLCPFSHADSPGVKKAIPYQMQVNDLKSLMLPQSDFEEAQALAGFLWTPFVLPLQNLTITNAALFVGYQENSEEDSTQKKFISAPKEGSCEILSYTSPEVNNSVSESEENILKTSQQKKTFVFINKTQQKRINTAIFFILEAESHKPIAVARLNAKGKSECLLRAQPYAISMGFGRTRHEIHIDGKSNTVNLKFPHVASLRITPSTANNIKNGDIVRVGRKINLSFTKKGIHEFPNIHIPAKIYSDLYVNADMMSHDLAVDEYLRTSFLVGDNKYQIEIEPGTYVAAVLRKNKLLCLNAFTLKSDQSFDLQCKTAQIKLTKEDIAYQFESDDTVFDVGFRPTSLIRNKNFVNWTVSTPGTILLGPPLLNETSTFNLNSLNEKDFFSIIFKERSSVSQISYGASISESINTFKIPLVGMSQENLLQGQVPFSEYIRTTSQKYFVPYFLNLTNVMHTNGAEISILEPVLTNTGALFATNNQNFLIRVMVPKWNTTQILEMYVNNKLSKRWILNRGDLSQPFAVTEKVNTYESENFTIKLVAHGESPLPNFLTGRDSFLPFAETREFCVSLDGKDKC